MDIEKRETETFVLTDIQNLDPVTVYVTNYQLGKGKIVIECYGQAWACYWGGMGENTLQQFFVTCENDYIIHKMIKETMQTDFDDINDVAHKKGFDLCVNSDVELAMQADDMAACFGPDWYMNLPTCHTSEYEYLGRILNAIKVAFAEGMQQAA